MAYRLPPLSSLRAFEAAARHLSFALAARELHVTPAAVSHQIKALESYLGVALFERLPRAVVLTAQGRALLPRVQEGFECFAAAIEAAREAGEGGLTVHAPPSFAQRWLVPRLAGFAAAHPEIALRVASDGANIDGVGAPPEDRLADLAAEPDVLAIRFGNGRYPGFRVERVLTPDYIVVGRPDLVAASALRQPADLLAHPLIHDESIPDASVRPSWAEWFRRVGVADADVSRGPRFSSAVLAVEAALAGQGVVLTLAPLVAADIAAGRLRQPFPERLASPYAYYMVTAEAQAERRPVRAFRDWLRAELARTSGAVEGAGSAEKRG
ncbi:MAG TPA: transcriptional regulator GcvA [Zoogloea sp.]|uniref:transcriptional regulator GcvA n=1 Tax=Zoogloea sp. TaxID=49181 RepID=UPI002BF9BB04|nr:transcriptional regulator GcvA [Zoogloea sp.]HMV17594.1 transcriptional regulator GcvA [Rhodocyclaceae bacterium]HMV63811.1 transcriptional regulator GcvA [Rhodocyclaceae bacterium]HMW52455.1 transcriptional regulator GcvA [Rhodocyclaceae bacterium]HMY49882.1 transcriptional regulator GcvA [Rhodocyclaceae bacterium]HMZ76954.1 transcriptional regulator GcvA [Rhodocyclaceae bacterium]